MYIRPSTSNTTQSGVKNCKNCHKLENLPEVTLKVCGACKGTCNLAYYCSTNCQRVDWNNGHREECKAYLASKNPQPMPATAPFGSLLQALAAEMKTISKEQYLEELAEERERKATVREGIKNLSYGQIRERIGAAMEHVMNSSSVTDEELEADASPESEDFGDLIKDFQEILKNSEQDE